MTQDNPDYRATFYRPREAWRDAWYRCGDIKVEYRLGMENGLSMLCRLMKLVGKPDGDIFVQEVGVKDDFGLWSYHHSIDKLAEYPVYSSDIERFWLDKPIYESLEKLLSSPLIWNSLLNQQALLARDFVQMDDGRATVTDLGKRVLDAWKAPPQETEPKTKKTFETPEIVSETIYESLVFLRDNPRKSNKLHSRTMSFLKKYGFIDDTNKLINGGLAAITRYEQYIVENPPVEKVKKEKKVYLSQQQVEAFEIIRKRPYRWLTNVATRTRNLMIGNGWVVEKDGIPSLTQLGATVDKTGVRP